MLRVGIFLFFISESFCVSSRVFRRRFGFVFFSVFFIWFISFSERSRVEYMYFEWF